MRIVTGTMEYTALREIGVGEGRNSKVYLANEPQLGGRVAIKEIEKTSFGDPTEYFAEAQAMFRTTHDNVVPIMYACETATTVSLAMPHFSAGSLARRIKDGPLRLGEVLRVAQGVLAGLAHIHLGGFVHFDVKPSNVLFSDGGVPMVADFGQSRPMSASGVATAPKIYLTAFPPEAWVAGVGTVHADIYQMGLLLYRALNGDPFFRQQVAAAGGGLVDKITRGRFPARDRFMPHVPRRLRTVVRKALQVDPAVRFQSATEMADALGRVQLALDWITEPLPAGGFRWTATRDGHADLIVELSERAGAWDVDCVTQRPGGPRRAKSPALTRRSGLSFEPALVHLKQVFERLP